MIKKQKLKIAQIAPYYFPSIGGVESVVQYVSEGLVNIGHEVYVYTANRNHKGMPPLNRPKVEQINGVSVNRLTSIFNLGHMSFCPSSFQQLWGGDFDIIHSHVYRHPHVEIASLVGQLKATPTILHGHGPFIEKKLIGGKKAIAYDLYDRKSKWSLFKRLDKIIALNEFEKEQYLRLGVASEKIETLPNATNNKNFNSVDSSSFLSKHKLWGKKIILFIGNLNSVKRPDLIIQALPALIKKIPNLFLLLVGPDEGYYKYIKSIGEKLRVEEYYKWIGPLFGFEKNQAYEAADLVILPSDTEIFGLVILEAMAHSKPVIGTDTVGSLTIIKDGETGFIVRKGNVEDIINRGIELLTNAKLLKKMGEKARRLVEKKYSASRMVDKIEALYFDLIEQKRK